MKQASLVVQLKDYSEVKSPAINFTVSVLNSKVPSISNVEYSIQE